MEPHKLNDEEILDVLIEAQKLVYANDYTIISALQIALADKSEHLVQVYDFLKEDIKDDNIDADSSSDRAAVFLPTIGRLAETLNYNLYQPMFEPDLTSEDFYLVLLVSKEYDEAMKKAEKEQEEKREEAHRQDREDLYYSRDD